MEKRILTEVINVNHLNLILKELGIFRYSYSQFQTVILNSHVVSLSDKNLNPLKAFSWTYTKENWKFWKNINDKIIETFHTEDLNEIYHKLIFREMINILEEYII